MATKWGIVSAGLISTDFVTAVNRLPKDQHQIVAVAARKLEDAEKFAKKHNISKAYGSYEDVAKDPNVDVVYIGSINTAHLPLSKLMLSYGKPVICEKPLCMNLKETRLLIECARQKKLFLMEGVWSRCFPAYRRILEELKRGTIGDVWQVSVGFGRQCSELDRMKKMEMGGGSTLDLGVYCVQFCQLVFGNEKPESIQASGFLNDDGVDVAISAVLKYSNNRIATLSTHSKVNLQNEAYILGTKGNIKIPFPFWCPTDIVINGENNFYPFEIDEKGFIFPNSAGLAYEAAEVKRCLQENLLESPLITHQETLTIAEIMETIRKQVGVVYPQD